MHRREGDITETTIIVAELESPELHFLESMSISRGGVARGPKRATFLRRLGVIREDLLCSEDIIPLLSGVLRCIKPAIILDFSVLCK